MAEIKTEVHAPVADTEHLSRDIAVQEEREVEVEPSSDVFDAVIEAARKLEAYAKAQEIILRLIIKQTYAGDWICHDKESTPIEQRKANLSAAGCERVANFLGVQETGWKEHPKTWDENHKHFTYAYEAEFSFRGISRHAIGRAGSHDKFFHYVDGKEVAVEDMNEDDIRQAAFRECVKKGVTRLFGLRQIPLTKLRELGYDLNLVKFAGFQDRGKQIKPDELKPGEGGLVWKTIMPMKVEKFEGMSKERKDKDGKIIPPRPWTRFDIHDKENVKYALFADGDSARVTALADAHAEAKPIKIGFRVVTFNNQQNYQIDKVEGAEGE